MGPLLLASSLALIVGSLLSAPPSEETLARYFPGSEEAA